MIKIKISLICQYNYLYCLNVVCRSHLKHTTYITMHVVSKKYYLNQEVTSPQDFLVITKKSWRNLSSVLHGQGWCFGVLPVAKGLNALHSSYAWRAEELILIDSIDILKRMLQNVYRIYKKCFLCIGNGKWYVNN